MNRKLRQPELDAALRCFPPILTPQEAADLLRIKISTLYRQVSEGISAHFKDIKKALIAPKGSLVSDMNKSCTP